MCGGGEKSGNFQEILLIKPESCPSIQAIQGCVSSGRTDWVGFVVPQ